LAARSRIEILDTTLRDGEQTPELAYTPSEKFQIARLLLRDVKVDRIEVGQTRVSSGEAQAVRRVAAWARRAGCLGRVEILGFVDGRASVDWILRCGGRVLNLLTKGSRRHCEGQLRLTPERHFKAIAETIRYARRRGLAVNVYLEDWSNGVRDSFDYVFAHVSHLTGLGVRRVLLPDTLGVLSPDEVKQYFGLMVHTWPGVHFDFHGQNDYGLATANSLAAVLAGARGVHVSVNGLGERAGNAHLAEVVAAIHDMSGFATSVDESKLCSIAEMVSTLSGKIVSSNTPIIGRDVFTHTAGVHADGEVKAHLYTTRLAAKRFGRRPRYALGKLAGRASLDQNLRALGINLLPKNRDLVLQRIVELGDKKHTVTLEDLPLIIADVLKTPEAELVRIDRYDVRTTSGELPEASVRVRYKGQAVEEKATGDGGYDAFMRALARATRRFGLKLPDLVDYKVRIPPGGKTGALVETVITWRAGARSAPFSTLGVDSDQVSAAVIATEKMLNLVAARSAAAGP
jgi:D-citramalate synthase